MYYVNCSKNCIALILVIAVLNCADAQMVQDTVKLSVDDPRPVAAAVQELVSRYGYVITYEDPRHVYQGDLEDVTAKVRKDLDRHPPGKAPKVIVPLDATLTLNIPSSSAITVQDMASVLEQLVQAQSSSGRGGRFRVERAGEVFHVLPTEVRDGNGNWASQTSILDVPISLPMEDRSADEMINAICNAVSMAARVQVGLTFNVGGISDPSRPRPYRLGADNERARDVLIRALNLVGTNQKRTWVLFYDPSENGHMYFLTIQGVPNRSSSPIVTGSSVPTGAQKTSTGTALSGTSVPPPKK
jgi:hypothetical protein